MYLLPLVSLIHAHAHARGPQVNIGSYPFTGEGTKPYNVKLLITSRDSAAVDAAAAAIREGMADIFDTVSK